MEDQTISCKDCGKDFTFTAQEQQYYADQGFKNVPTRCLDCRKNMREKKEATKPKFEVVCSKCQKKIEAPFEPTAETPLFCQKCFEDIKKSSKN
jgi:CxxC-x17-CxxC domain-containing protein